MKRFIALALLGVLVAAPTHAQTRNPMEQEVLKASRALEEASITKKDRGALERYYADEYVYTHSNGTVLNKAQEISSIMSPDQAWTAYKIDDAKARIYGNVAIATGLETLTGTSKAYASGARRFTEVFVRRNGRWQMVGGQTTLVPTK